MNKYCLSNPIRERIDFVKSICIIVFLAASASLFAAEPAVKCESLAAKSLGDDVKISSALLVPAKGSLPEHCDVRGVIWPEAQFAN